MQVVFTIEQLEKFVNQQKTTWLAL